MSHLGHLLAQLLLNRDMRLDIIIFNPKFIHSKCQKLAEKATIGKQLVMRRSHDYEPVS